MPQRFPTKVHVRPGMVKMRNPGLQDQPEMTLVERNKEVEAFAAQCPVRNTRAPMAVTSSSRIVRKVDLLECLLVVTPVAKARDDELTRCRKSWICSGSC